MLLVWLIFCCAMRCRVSKSIAVVVPPAVQEKLVNEATFSSPKRSDLKTPPSWVVNRAALDFAKPTVDLVELESIRRDLREQVEANAAKLLQVAQFEADFAASLSDPAVALHQNQERWTSLR